MKWFEQKWWLLAIATAVGGGATGVLAYTGQWAVGTLAGIITLCMCVVQWALVRKVIDLMGRFMSGLEMNDTTMMFGNYGGSLGKITRSMNRLTEIYRSNNMELETRKLYYDRILRVMTHEMRNAITPVIALTEDMKQHGERYDRESREEALSVILSQSSGIKRFLDSYYTLTYLADPKREKINGKAFFTQIMRLAQIEAAALKAGNDVLDVTVANGLIIKADKDLLSQAVGNIVKNALEAASCRPKPSVKIDATRMGDEVRIMIEDNGCGFEEDTQFMPFHSTKPGGSGIGLCLSRQIARLHGGDVKILSTSAHGTKMLMTISYQ